MRHNKYLELIFLKSQLFFKTDIRYLIKNLTLLTAGKFIASFSGIILAIFFANFLPTEVYGQYKYILSVLGIASITALQAMNTSVAISVAKGFEGSLKKSLIEKMKWSTIGSVGLIVVSAYYHFSGNTELSITFFIAGLFCSFLRTPLVVKGYLNGKKKFKQIAIFEVLETLCTSTALITTIIFTNNLLLIIFAFLATQTLVRWCIYFYITENYNQNQLIEPNTIPFGRNLSAIQAISIVSNHADKIIMWHSLGATSLANYAFAIAIPNQMRTFLKSLLPIALPKFSVKESSVIKKTLPLKVLKLTVIMGVVVVLYILVAPIIYNTLFPQYTDAIFFSQLYALVLLFFPRNFLSDAIVTKAKKKDLYIITYSTHIVKLLLLISLTPTLGISGAIYAELIAATFNSLIVLYFFKKL